MTLSRPEDFEQESNLLIFKKSASDYGYKGKKDKNLPLFYIRTRNRVKHEIKFVKRLNCACIVTGFGRSDEDKKALKGKIEELGYNLLQPDISSYVTCEYEDLEQFFSLAEEIERVEELVALRATEALFGDESRIFSPERIARRYFFAVERKDAELLALSRLLLSADRHDEAISLNKRTSIRTYREHVVPCTMIHWKIIDMIMADNASLDEVADLIRRNLKIAHIKKEDAALLDFELGWKTVMPKNDDGTDWQWGDSITARLEKAGIEW